MLPSTRLLAFSSAAAAVAALAASSASAQPATATVTLSGSATFGSDADSNAACACAPPAETAPIAVVVAAPAPASPRQRWGVGLRVGSLSLRPAGRDLSEEQRDAAATEYAVGGLQVRYRATARWELELAFEHAHEQLADGSAGGAMFGVATMGALVHMRPGHAWDWYLLGSLGVAQDAAEGLSDEQREASTQGVAHLGIGVERRFRHLGISAELRAIGMAPTEDAHDHGGGADRPAARAAPLVVPEPESDAGTAGGQVTIGATYYF